ncbi:hypothetical protein ACFLT9_13225 [Acidobacteriota bacterium]
MKRALFVLFFLTLAFTIVPQQVLEEAVVINIEVPVRVFDGDRFIDNLTINDFELLEDGVPQNIEAVYLVKKRSIERSEENKRFAPKTMRSFYLFFEISEYTSRVGDAVNYLIQNVLFPGDQLFIVTPMKTYRLRAQALEVKSREQIVNQLKGLLRKDTEIGSSEYRDILDELTGTAAALTALVARNEQYANLLENARETTEIGEPNEDNPIISVDEQLVRYEQLLFRLENIRKMDQSQLLNFADILKDEEGQRYVFLFYEREFIPQIESRILNQYRAMYQNSPNILQTLSNLFDFYRRPSTVNVDLVKKRYADSSISIHFLFLSPPPRNTYGVTMMEHSEDVYSVFKEMAQATGGFSDTSARADILFQKALTASENYYLLYYTPSEYKEDGEFNRIEVRLKNNDLRVVHRLGYFSK